MENYRYIPFDVTIDGKRYLVREEKEKYGTFYSVAEFGNPDSKFTYIDSEMFVCWGIKYEPRNYFAQNILGDECVELEDKITITRNGIDFYSFNGDINTGIDKARIIINKLKQHEIKFEYRNYDRRIVGTKIVYKGKDYTVKKWFHNTLKIEIQQNYSYKTEIISIFDESLIWGYNKRKNEHHCFVYYILNEDRSKIKIGISHNPTIRAKNIQTSSGEEIELLNTIEFDTREQALRVEDFLHRQFSKYRMKHTKVSKSSEWFNAEILKTLFEKYRTREQIENAMQLTTLRKD